MKIKHPIIHGKKICTSCEKNLPINKFRKRIAHGKPYLVARCRKCDQIICKLQTNKENRRKREAERRKDPIVHAKYLELGRNYRAKIKNIPKPILTHDNSKWCKKCHKQLLLENFRQRTSAKGTVYRIGDCVKCEKKIYKAWENTNLDYFAKYNKLLWEKHREVLPDAYIKGLFFGGERYKGKMVPKEVIELKRAQLKLTRKIKQLAHVNNIQ